MPMHAFHPVVARWFEGTFAAPTPAQAQAWQAIRSRRHTLVAAPTGSGKTLAAFMAAIDSLVQQGLAGELRDETYVVYVSPLRALSNDIQRNLGVPLSGIRAALQAQGLPDIEIRSAVRTGDTPSAERDRLRRRAPHILVTTPESLYVLLGSVSGRKMLQTVRTVIVDEIHSLAPNKRGAHLALSLERLAALCPPGLVRIGLSATQDPIDLMAKFLVGAGAVRHGVPDCTIVDSGHRRKRDLAIELPSSPLEAVMSAEVWQQVYDRLAQLIEAHRTTLIFVNTRRLAERVTRQLSERLGRQHVAAHHGSLAKEHRLDAEQRLKGGTLKALVATASLELGIDIGEVDLVCQLASPRSIASFLQRIGRSGHAVNGVPKGRIFPLSRDELVESAALLDSVRRGEMDRLAIPRAPLDVLAQQIVAETAAVDWNGSSLHALVRRAWPYRDLAREDFQAVVTTLAEGFTTRRGRRGALVHHDAVNQMLRGRRGARMTGLTSGGTIPDNADYQVILEPESLSIGTVNEDFAVESLAGDVFQLGNHSYRIMRVERGVVRVADAAGMAPNIPFWLGEAPGRSDELSSAVSRLRGELGARFRDEPSGRTARSWLLTELALGDPAADQLCDYLGAAQAALGCVPTQDRLVFERFFDESGGMQLVIHSPHGSRLNRAWGLALRKRFCRKFNFELQAAATEDNIVLSLTAAHSFPLDEVARYLHSATIRELLIQAVLDAPMFITRWRWVAGIALALPRFRGGKKVPPQIARMNAEDLVSSVFPDQLACAENLPGDREIPDHPLVRQTIEDCLNEAMDLPGLQRLLAGLESGSIAVVARDLTEPSPMAAEVLSARPYAYLDDAPLEERRTQAVMGRRWASPESVKDLGRLDPEAIARVRCEAWPSAENADELHDALVWLGFLTAAEVQAKPDWRDWLADLGRQKRAASLQTRPGERIWIAAERLPQFRALWPKAHLDPAIAPPPAHAAREWVAEEALTEILRGRLEGLGPVAELDLATALGLGSSDVRAALAGLEAEGFALQGRFTPGVNEDQWCERRLLARIHQYTIKRLRAEIEPVSARDFMRFLLNWQRVTPDTRMEGSAALEQIVAQLEGFEAPAGAWEAAILPARLNRYDHSWLDEHCVAGRVTWARLRPGASHAGARHGAVRSTPIALLARRHARLWASLASPDEPMPKGAPARALLALLRENGASFFEELTEGAGLLEPQVEEGLTELVALGLITSDSFDGLRTLLLPNQRKKSLARRHSGGRSILGIANAGRWALARHNASMPTAGGNPEAVEHVARRLLLRYGVVFWRLLEREASWLPPWRDLLRVYRRLEARGEIRGGRFVAGFSGEQYALPQAIASLRALRREPGKDTLVSLSGADPLNLAGILTPGPKLPALPGNRILYRDGLPIATLAGGKVQYLGSLDARLQWEARKLLMVQGRASPPGLAA
ncbi:MAG: DEAD/DEAH box helicase [Alphaproteobacteria bacterium]|nr:DEAD/DEAH box helicase [Alphaproteobacteria bacterium]